MAFLPVPDVCVVSVCVGLEGRAVGETVTLAFVTLALVTLVFATARSVEIVAC